MALTPRQKQLLDFIADFIDEHGYSPSYEEIARGLGLASLATVHKHIQALEQKGYLARAFNRSRSVDVSPAYLERYRAQRQRTGARALEIPLEGRIAAGTPVEVYPQPEMLSLGELVRDREVYALRVWGDSMVDDHILDGDYVLIERTQDVRNGDVVVALVDGTETTLKRIYFEPQGMVRLQPANVSMRPIVLPRSRVQVQGRLLAVLRRYH